jgi:hypothetical protein
LNHQDSNPESSKDSKLFSKSKFYVNAGETTASAFPKVQSSDRPATSSKDEIEEIDNLIKDNSKKSLEVKKTYFSNEKVP